MCIKKRVLISVSQDLGLSFLKTKFRIQNNCYLIHFLYNINDVASL